MDKNLGNHNFYKFYYEVSQGTDNDHMNQLERFLENHITAF